MRPSIATDSKQQLRIACDMLRGYGVTRSQRARAVYHEPFIPAAPQAQAPRQHVSISAELERAIWRIRIQALLRRILIGIGLVILLWCAAWLVQVAPHGWYDPHQHELELQAQRQWRIDHPISDSDSPPAVQAPSPRPQIALRAVLVRDARVSQPRVSPTALATTRYTWHNVAPYGDLELNIIGRLPSTRDLPASGSIGDAYLIDEHYWVWAQPVWAAIPTWCDP